MPRSETTVSRQVLPGARGIPLLYGAALILWLWWLPALVGIGHDDGVYLHVAQSIRAGEAWTDRHLPLPVQSTRYPPLYPLVLAGGGWLTGTPADGMEGADRLVALNGLFLALALGLFVRLLGRAWRRPAPLVLALALAAFLLLDLLFWASLLFSESLFLAAALAALHAATRYHERPTTGRFAWMVLTAALVPLIRTLGLAVTGAVALDLVLRTRRPRLGAAFLLRVAMLGGPLLVWAQMQGGLDPAWDDFTLIGRSYGHLLAEVGGRLPALVAFNLVQLADCLREALVPWWSPDPGSGFAGRVALIAGLGVLAGLGAPRLPALIRYYLLLGLGLLLLWPYPTPRLLHPFLPFLLWAQVMGAERLLRRWPAPGRTWILVALLGLLAMGHGWEARNRRPRVEEAGWTLHQPVAELREAAEWIRGQGQGDEVLAGALDPLLSFWAERPGVWYWCTDQAWLERYQGRAGQWRALFRGPLPESARDGLGALAEEVLRQYRRVGVTWLVVCGQGGHPWYEPLVRGLVTPGSPYAGQFRLGFQSRGGMVRVYRFLGPS